jgi:D-3-phosphoglycerate dehydrogenase
MSARVVLLDRAGEIGYVEQALVDVPDLRVELADRLPRGPGIVALLVPPEVAVRAADVAALPDLRIVAATSTGYDHLELDALPAAGVWATHSPGYCDEEVAEHAVAFALDLLRGVTNLDRCVHAGLGLAVGPAAGGRRGPSSRSSVSVGLAERWRGARAVLGCA